MAQPNGEMVERLDADAHGGGRLIAASSGSSSRRPVATAGVLSEAPWIASEAGAALSGSVPRAGSLLRSIPTHVDEWRGCC